MTLAFKDDFPRSVSESIRRARPQRVIVFCAGAILLAVVAYIAASSGFDAVVKCQIRTHSVLSQGRGAMSQIALSSACGF
jgi:hypothetical protein